MNIDLIKKSGKMKVYNKDDVICHENEMGESVYLLLAGKACVLKKNKILHVQQQVAKIKTGTVFGETSLFGNKRNASVVANTDQTIVLEFETEEYKRLLDQEPRFAFMLLRALIIRIDSAMDRLIAKDPAFVFNCRSNDTYKVVKGLDCEQFMKLVNSNYTYPLTASKELNDMLMELNNRLLS